MKFIIAFLAIVNSFSLFAGLKKDKVGEALIRAQFQQIKDHFFYSLSEDPSLLKKTDELNQSSLQKTYGPYQLVLKEIEPGTRFGLYQFNLLGVDKPPFVCSGYIDEHGEAWIKKKEGDIKLANALQLVGGMLPGEPIYSMVVLGDKKTYIAACLIPNPIEAYGKDGRHVTMQLFTHRNPLYMVCGEHFKPNEAITLSIHSKGGTTIKHLKASEDGTFIDIVEGDRSNGLLETESMQIASAEQTDLMTISYDWKFLEATGGKKMCNHASDRTPKKMMAIVRNCL